MVKGYVPFEKSNRRGATHLGVEIPIKLAEDLFQLVYCCTILQITHKQFRTHHLSGIWDTSATDDGLQFCAHPSAASALLPKPSAR
jgi:hypothetical protein